ncbi:type IV secretion protein IcmB [Acidithiobacillus sp. MC6.1]|nr:type IV secretion protein IcmB [Acidithiobacillus sp. MC6.1]
MLAGDTQLHGIHQWDVLSQQVENEADDDSETGIRQVIKSVSEHRQAIVTEGGGLASYFWLDGSKSLIDQEGLFKVAHEIAQMMGTLFDRPGIILTMRYFRDITRAKKQFNKNLEALTEKVERLGFKPEMADFLMHRSRLSQFYVPQGILLCVESTLASLDKDIIKNGIAENAKKVRKSNIPLWALRQGQNPFRLIDDMDMKHRSMVGSFEGMFRHPLINLSAIPLDVDDVVTILRNQIGTDAIYDLRRPVHVSSQPEPRVVDGQLLVAPSRVAESVLPEDMENLRGGVVRSGSGYFVPMVVSLGVTRPEDATMANLLHDLRTDLPLSMTIQLKSAGLSLVRSKKFVATMVKFTNKTANDLIQKSCMEMENAYLESNDPVVSMQMIFETWAWQDEKDGSPDLAMRRSKSLESLLRTNWGVILQRRPVDPLLAHMASIPGLMAKNHAPILPVNLSDALRLWPLGMATSPWSAADPAKATFQMRSIQRKMMPIQLGDSTVQNSFIGIIFGLSGYGKSVMVANQILSLILSQNDRLPYLALIDVGYGGLAIIEMLRYFLKDPDLAVGFDLHTRGMLVNPFDTPLGYREPLGSHKAFLVNLITMVVRSPGQHEEDFVDQVAIQLVDAVYRLRGDGAHGRAHRYVVGKHVEVDAAVREQGISVDNITKWWDIVDALFACKDDDTAMVAQRYAVPTLSDLIEVCNNDPVITSQFGDIKHPKLGISILKLIALSVTQAVDRWPMLSGASDFSLGKARLMAVNLEHVAKDRSESGLRQAGIMYLMARFLLTRDFLFHPLDAQSAPESYRRYHELRAERLFTTPKMGVYDELHNTNGLPAITNQIEKDAREWRKNMGILLLASQMPQDFSDVLVNIATSIYILTNPYGEGDTTLTDKFPISHVEADMIRHYCIGAGEGGSAAFCIWRTKSGGEYKQIAYVMAPPAELWAYTTTPKDRQLRLFLTSKLGYVESLDVLSQRYPGGSCMNDLARRKGIVKQKEIDKMMWDANADALDPEVKALGEEIAEMWNRYFYRNMKTA